ncbi:MAG: O-antigen ligase family protein [Arcobacter sp.]|nr:O-antigen ligase family protein [Arcobacter sp.]
MFADIIDIIKHQLKSKNFSIFFLAMAMFFLPLSINISSYCIVVSILLKSIQIFFFKQKLFSVGILKYSFTISIVFFIYICLNLFVQNNFSIEFVFFEKEFSKLLLLIVTPILLEGEKINKITFYSFICGVIFLIAYTFIVSIFSCHNGVLSRDAFIDNVDLHHTYLGIYLLTLVNFLFSKLIRSKEINIYKKSLSIGFIIFSFCIIYLVNSKVSIVLFFVLLAWHFLPEITRKKVFKHLLVLSVFLFVFYLFNNKASVSYEMALDFRIQIWEAGLKVIKNNIFFGVLTNPEKDVLNYQHYLDGKYYFLDSDLNMHNQYLSFLMRFGIIGVAIFSLLAIMPIILMFKLNRVNKEFIGFSIIVLMVFYIENILNRHHGIVFFTFFYNYYLVKLSHEKN